MKRHLTSLDRWADLEVEIMEPDRYRTLLGLDCSRKLIARGSGLSYVGAGFGPESASVSMRRFNRMLGYDPDSGELSVEAGATLGDICGFLLRHGRMLSVLPGYPLISVGGAIAFDSHGKHQYRDGLFSNHVRKLTLFHPERGVSTLDAQDETGLFQATCGGAGLTGIVLSARLATIPFPWNEARMEVLPAADLMQTVELLEAHKDSADILYSWNDFSLPRRRGRGHVVTGSFRKSEKARAPHASPARPLTPPLPRPLLNARTTPVLNELFRLWSRMGSRATSPVWSAIFPIISKRFYYALYGRPGLTEKQFLVPREEIRTYIPAFQRLCERFTPCGVLASCKLFTGERRNVAFSGTGFCLNIDVPHTESALPFLDALDGLNTEAGCISNLAKDSHISGETVRKQYGANFEAFAAALERADPRRIFSSTLSRRLGL